MAKIIFTRSEARRLLGLQDNRDVDALVKSRRLEISAYTRRGLPLFDGDHVRRVAGELVREEPLPP